MQFGCYNPMTLTDFDRDGNGLHHYRDNVLSPFVENDVLESRNITVLQQHQGRVVFGTTRGLYQYQDSNLSRLGVGSALYNSYITALLVLPDNTIIAATLDDGIFISQNQGGWLQWHSGNGLPHSPVVSLIYDIDSATVR